MLALMRRRIKSITGRLPSKAGVQGILFAALLITPWAGLLSAESDPIAVRKAMMREGERNAALLVRMIRRQIPYDALKVDSAFAQWAEMASKFPLLFPANSKFGQKTRAASTIWMTKADFDASSAEFGKVVSEHRERARASLEGLRSVLSAVGDACDNCHKKYRLSVQ
ncbi:MAG TPA: cytochrome c [Pseudolabrys sp.]|nr:cytochrome c [Pseudolabrys sp.]